MNQILFSGKDQFVTTKLEIVFNVLKENILNGNLQPGARLIIKKIAQELGVSEIPVREAIRMLESQGLVTITPHAGAEVVTFDIEDIEEIFNVRGLLEGYAARTALPFITDEIIAELNTCLEEMRQCIKMGDIAAFGVLNREFHRKIYILSPYKRLYRMLFDLWDGAERTRAVFSYAKSRPQESLKEHEEIIKVLMEGDGDKVEQLFRKHKERVGKVFVESIKQIEKNKLHNAGE
ncbi:MAG: GntR family transcriptional regulator [Clostridia bacterium]|nr:GntR family transcriptional regulator [Clostridia bacterium]